MGNLPCMSQDPHRYTLYSYIVHWNSNRKDKIIQLAMQIKIQLVASVSVVS